MKTGFVCFGILAATYALAAYGPGRDSAAAADPQKLIQLGGAPSLTYEQMARTPEQYKGQAVCLKGQIVDVSDPRDGRAQVGYGIDLIEPGRHLMDSLISAGYTRSSNEPHLLAWDNIEFCGTFIGPVTYKTAFGADNTVPLVAIDVIKQGPRCDLQCRATEEFKEMMAASRK